jgi:hypothetical protein
VATWNPVSYIVEGLRAPLVFGWDGQAIGLGFAISALFLAVTLLAATSALRTRLTRT